MRLAARLSVVLVLASLSSAAPAPAPNVSHVRHVRSKDPALVEADDATVRGWLQQNADRFGGRAEDNEPRTAAGAQAYFLLDPDLGEVTGTAILRRTHGVLDVTIVRAKRSPEAVAMSLVGTRHVQTLRYGTLPERDCKMGGRSRACEPRVTATTKRTVTLTAEGIAATLQLRVIRGAIRLVVCVSADVEPPDDERELVSMSLSGLPFAVDAETGRRIAVSSCVPEL